MKDQDKKHSRGEEERNQASSKLVSFICFVLSHSSTRRKYVTSTWKMRRLIPHMGFPEAVSIIPPHFRL